MIRLAHARAEELHDVRQQLAAQGQVLRAAVDLLATYSRRLEAISRSNIALRAEFRALMHGTTTAVEMPQAEADAVAEWAKQDAA